MHIQHYVDIDVYVGRHDLGVTDVPFCLQSCVKPLVYAMTLNDLHSDEVHKYVGQEPSGRSFNELTLDYQRKWRRHTSSKP